MTGGPPPLRQLPGWKSPCTMVSGRPHSSSRGNRLSSPRAAATSPALSSPATSPSSSAAICPAMTGVRRSASPGGRRPARCAWPARIAWVAARRWTALVMICGDASQQSSPGTCSSRTRPGPAPMTGGTRAGSTRANAAMAPASSAAKRGVALSQTGPLPVGSRNSAARFQVRLCSAAPVTRRPAARSVSDAQVSISRMPSSRAHGERSSSGPFSVA
jgi:hypothetical protein